MNDNNLVTGSLNKHFKKIAIPASIGFLFNTLFNVVDTYFAGYLGTDAIAGMAISFPIFFLLISISMGLGNSTTALSAIAIGKKDSLLLHQYTKNALFLGILFGLSIPFITPLFIEQLFELTGAEGNVLQIGLDYTYTILFGTIFFVLNYVINGFLNAQGNTKPFRNFLIIGFFVNILLDSMFVLGFWFIPAMGVQGIALATVIVQGIGTVYLTYNVLRSNAFKLELYKEATIKLKTIKELMSQAIPSTLSTATIALGVFIINYFVLRYGGSDTIAAYGVSMRIEQIALIPTIGLNIAVLSIVGQSFGAKSYYRIKETRNKATLFGVIIMLIATVIIVPFAPFFISLFDSNPDVIRAGAIYLRIEAIAFTTYVILNINVSVLQGIKKPKFTIIIGVYRQIFPFILFFFLGTTLSLGIYGVWWGIVIINWSAVLIIYLYTNYELRKLKKTSI